MSKMQLLAFKGFFVRCEIYYLCCILYFNRDFILL